MARLTQKHKKTIVKVIDRWAETYSGTRPVNYDRIRQLIDIGYSQKKKSVRVKSSRARNRWREVYLTPPKIHYVSSPVAFEIAQAVLRGRLAKKDALEVCELYGIDNSFVADLRRDKMTTSYGRHHWHRGSDALSDIWHSTLEVASTEAQNAVFIGLRDRDEDEPSPRDRARERTVNRWLKLFPEHPRLPMTARGRRLVNNDVIELTKTERKVRDGQTICVLGNFACKNASAKVNQWLIDVPWSSNANTATLNRCDRASIQGYGTSYIDAEILYTLLGVSNLEQIWAYELMHEACAVMTFENQALVLAENPTTHFNANGELHNDEGPAVLWADGAKQYYIDGHALGDIGEYIVDKPEQLTVKHINQEENEEVKRLAIDKYGWGRYLDDINASVLDRRENAVDNTIEALVSIKTKIWQRQWGWSSPARETELEQRKLILSCRSTARQYFLAVPEFVNTCEEGQRWMAEGSNNQAVAALNHPVRVIGAS
jgi:hypothetical protein